MIEIEVTVRPVVLSDGHAAPWRGCALRAAGKRIAHAAPGPVILHRRAGAGLLYTDETSTRLEQDDREIACWSDPFEALAAVATGHPDSVCLEGERSEGMDFVGGWVGVLGYDLARQIERLPEIARCAIF